MLTEIIREYALHRQPELCNIRPGYAFALPTALTFSLAECSPLAQPAQDEPCRLLALPEPLLQHILTSLPGNEALAAGASCRALHEAVRCCSFHSAGSCVMECYAASSANAGCVHVRHAR